MMWIQKYKPTSLIFNSSLEKAKFAVTYTENKFSSLSSISLTLLSPTLDNSNTKQPSVFKFAFRPSSWFCGKQNTRWKLAGSQEVTEGWGWEEYFHWAQRSELVWFAEEKNWKQIFLILCLAFPNSVLFQQKALLIRWKGQILETEGEVFIFTISSFQSKLQFSELSPACRRGVSQWSNNDTSRAL